VKTTKQTIVFFNFLEQGIRIATIKRYSPIIMSCWIQNSWFLILCQRYLTQSDHALVQLTLVSHHDDVLNLCHLTDNVHVILVLHNHYKISPIILVQETVIGRHQSSLLWLRNVAQWECVSWLNILYICADHNLLDMAEWCDQSIIESPWYIPTRIFTKLLARAIQHKSTSMIHWLCSKSYLKPDRLTEVIKDATVH
jgi:hypothetical protein